MKCKPKKTDYRQGLEPWMNNKRKNKTYKKKKEAEAEANLLMKAMSRNADLYYEMMAIMRPGDIRFIMEDGVQNYLARNCEYFKPKEVEE